MIEGHKFLAFFLRARMIPGVRILGKIYYKSGQKALTRIVKQAERATGEKIIKSIYLCNNETNDEILYGASELEFLFVLHEIPANLEMEFLKKFWVDYREIKRFFPFLGNTLMCDEAELQNWLLSPTMRSFKAPFCWKLIHGEKALKNLSVQQKPALREVYSQALRCYWILLQPIIKLRNEFMIDRKNYPLDVAICLRDVSMAMLELFRMHEVFFVTQANENLYSASFEELIDRLSSSRYGKELLQLKNFLHLKNVSPNEEIFAILSSLLFRAFQCLNEMAKTLTAREPATSIQQPNYKISCDKKSVRDAHSLAMRELYAERILIRYPENIKQALLSENNSHMFFSLSSETNESLFREIIMDLRSVNFSFDEFSVAMPLSEMAYIELQRTSFLDDSFHTFQSHRELSLNEDGHIITSAFKPTATPIKSTTLQKAFAEVSFALRFQPPPNIEYLLEKIVTPVLNLRLALEHGEVVTDFASAMRAFSEKHLLRGKILEEQLASCSYVESQGENQFWQEIEGALERLHENQPKQAPYLKAQLDRIQESRIHRTEDNPRTTDVWINLTPFLRREMNSIKDRVFTNKPRLMV